MARSRRRFRRARRRRGGRRSKAFYRRRFRKFVSKRFRGRRRRIKRAGDRVQAGIKGIDGISYWNREGVGIADSDYATFNIYPFPSCPYGTTNESSPVGGFVTGAQATQLALSNANTYCPALPSLIDSRQIVTASSEVQKLCETYEQFRIKSVELVFMQNKRPGTGTAAAGTQQGYTNNLFLLYNYCEHIAPQALGQFVTTFLGHLPDPADWYKGGGYAFYQDWNDIAAISMESNRNSTRSGWHRKLLTPDKPVKMFWRPKHYPVGGSTQTMQWFIKELKTPTYYNRQYPLQPMGSLNRQWVSCDFIRKLNNPQYNLFWTGPVILMVDSACGVGGTYGVGPLGGSQNVFQHVFGVTVKYYVKIEFRGIRTDRYRPNDVNDVMAGGELVSDTEEADITIDYTPELKG